jgi:ATP phosphoribosyltransferase
MNKLERIQIAVPGGELKDSVLDAVTKSGLEFTAVDNDKRYLHRRQKSTC